ncbi:hypothetical protein K438DRAFT_2001914 [Mycena galopus ATCC 62051]|nr:hypothetical protein K438DRAFT_2001914 [Mycena galopus ATCC 62051]
MAKRIALIPLSSQSSHFAPALDSSSILRSVLRSLVVNSATSYPDSPTRHLRRLAFETVARRVLGRYYEAMEIEVFECELQERELQKHAPMSPASLLHTVAKARRACTGLVIRCTSSHADVYGLGHPEVCIASPLLLRITPSRLHVTNRGRAGMRGTSPSAIRPPIASLRVHPQQLDPPFVWLPLVHALGCPHPHLQYSSTRLTRHLRTPPGRPAPYLQRHEREKERVGRIAVGIRGERLSSRVNVKAEPCSRERPNPTAPRPYITHRHPLRCAYPCIVRMPLSPVRIGSSIAPFL